MRLAAASMLALAVAAVTAPASAAPPLVLSRPAPLWRGTLAMPRIVSPKTDATARINAALVRVDGRWRAFTDDCREQARDNDTGRDVAVTMRGPRYLSLVIRYDYSCSGAHPDTGTIALVYDLETGRPVNWASLLPPGLEATGALDTAGDGSNIGMVSSPVLHALYLKAVAAAPKMADADDCTDVLAEPGMPFQLWPDAAAGGVVMEPASLPHVVAVCAQPETIPNATLRRLGVAPRLLDAIDAAHVSGRNR